MFTLALVRFPPTATKEIQYLNAKGALTYTDIAGAPVLYGNLPPREISMKDVFRSGDSSKKFKIFFSSRRRHTRCLSDWSSDVCSSDLGPNPDAFDPENFSREAEAARPVNAWKPFGNGQRACIGRGFAMHEAALAIGMILQRFKLIDHHRYQMLLKETLTIKPDGLKIGVGRRVDKDRGTFAGRATPTAAVSTAAAPRARTRPGHNTPLLVLYGSNLGSAEELATRVADLAEVNGFATKLAPLDDYVGKLPEQGGVLIVCASYNGAAPDNAKQFVKSLGGELPKDAFSKARYALLGCGNSDWAATYQSIPRMIDEQLAAHGGKSVYARGEGDARSDLDGQFESWFAKLPPRATKEFGVESNFTRSAEDEPLYRIEPVAPSAVNAIVAL